jgi:hypothetical protein
LLLGRRIAGVERSAQVRWGWRVLLATLGMALAVWFAAQAATGVLERWQPPVGGAKVKMLSLLVSVGVVGMLVYIGAGWVFGVEEVRYAVMRIRQKVGRV